uniref:large ribosomal subunit protein mL37 n=1 Tax=Myxine glutinosa TaxID=7769 RepID=UPI00358F69E4
MLQPVKRAVQGVGVRLGSCDKLWRCVPVRGVKKKHGMPPFRKFPPPRETMPDIPAAERMTYGDLMHYVPGLATPRFPDWERGWDNPFHRKRQPNFEPSPGDTPCYIFNQRIKLLDGERQAAWLAKALLQPGLPSPLAALAADPALRDPTLTRRAECATQHACLWDQPEGETERDRANIVLLHSLLHTCRTSRPDLVPDRVMAQDARVSAAWHRDETKLQVRGLFGPLLSSSQPLPVLAPPSIVEATVDSPLDDNFWPVLPTIDLQKTFVFTMRSQPSFAPGYPCPYAHTLFILNPWGARYRKKLPQLRAQMLLFSFAHALARAHATFGETPQDLKTPMVVQSIASDGRIFLFGAFQLNTTDLAPCTGLKNLAWFDEPRPLFSSSKYLPVIKRKQLVVPSGLLGFEPDTFYTLLAFYLNGACSRDAKHVNNALEP